MVLKQKPIPEKGAPNGCYHVTSPTAHEDVKSFLKGVEREASPRRQHGRQLWFGVDKPHELYSR